MFLLPLFLIMYATTTAIFNIAVIEKQSFAGQKTIVE
jgi:hypothetical protein